LTFANNTLSRLHDCIHLEVLPLTDGTSRVVVRNNLIIGASSLVAFGQKVDPDQPGGDHPAGRTGRDQPGGRRTGTFLRE
jgi:hypothetical protein